MTSALRRWWSALATPPAPLARGQRMAALAAALLAGASRLAAVSATPWDWDEMLFALAVRDYDVTAHRPHPPGFPLFVGAAKLLPLEPFESLRALVVLASLFVLPAAFFLARELRAGFPTALGAATLLSFFPNVWLHGGTAFSDVPAMVLAVAAGALLLRGCRGSASLIAGAVVLGAGAAVRPQNLLLGAVPLLLAFSHRRRTALAGAAIAAAIVFVSFGAAAEASGGWQPYREALRRHQAYIRAHDSFVAPVRPPLIQVADDFFVRPWRFPLMNAALTALALLSLVTMRRRPHRLAAIAVFGPFALLAWLVLDFHSASRFSIAWMPMVALLAADAVPERSRLVVSFALAATMAAWSWPAVRIVRETASPPAAAAQIVRSMDPASTVVFVDARLGPHGHYLLPGYDRREADGRRPAVMHERAAVVLIREGRSNVAGARNFERDGHDLARIFRPRYFAVSLVPAERLEFGDGWYGEEGDARSPFRWMGKRGVVRLPARAGRSTLSMRLVLPAAAALTVRTDGGLLARIEAGAGPIERSWEVAGAAELTIETTAVVRVAGDPRELGLRLERLDLR